MRNWIKRAITLLCMVAILFQVMPGTVYADERTIKDVQQEIEEKKALIKQLEENIDQNKNNREAAEGSLVEYQVQYDLMIALIDEQQVMIESTGERLTQKTEHLSETIASIKENEAYYTERLQAIYQMNGSSAMLGMLLSTESFTDVVRVGDALQRISQRDTELLQDLDDKKTRYQEQKAEIEQMIEDLNAQMDQLESDKAYNAEMMEKMKSAIASYNYQITLSEQEVEVTEAERDALIAELAEMFRRLQYKGSQAGDDSVRYDGPLLWPVPGNYRISSYYGAPRSNTRSHYGIDIPASTGTPIIAAASGLVLEATWHYSYGYYVVLDHGQGLRTLYAHCSELWVSEGMSVTVGDSIAGVGNTGNSYGAHLHFEVHEHGSRQNPLGSGYLVV